MTRIIKRPIAPLTRGQNAGRPRARALCCALALALGGAFASAAAQAAEWKVGVELPLTGPLAQAGTEMYRGIQVAADLYNRRHPQDKITLVAVDDESNPAKAVAAVEQLASQHVVAIAGAANSNCAGPASEAASKAGIVYVTSGGTSDDMVSRGLKNFFRVSNTPGYTKGMTGLFDSLGVKSVAILYSTKDATSDLARQLDAALKAKGVKTYLHAYDPSISDFKPLINKVKLQDKPDALAMLGYENDYVGILRAARVLKPDLKAIAAPWAFASPKMAQSFPDLVPNVYGATVLASPADYRSADQRDFSETYQRLFKTVSNYQSQTSFVYAQVLFDAIAQAQKAGTLDKGGLADTLRATQRDDTFLGKVSFDARGDNPHYVAHMGQFARDGKLALVWPQQVATAKPAYPGVPW
ncbi:Amino acid/amide ABC transporter substrate-binding protein (HAAT family) [Paraburkholderia tropica]|uniref:ABC transporter substrate-binding protein n=1 Tax=Paraburkholderia tropica TaxID=92647 RepID=UPI001CAE8D7A|nr:ABC transporter substrate-binding protein [Paraburkholderia tropica]CAG9200340.1 Amino acid/amide ABC transporter substrate-binding protein (HAAT family) [Paraburkholderia tropica]